ncbi:tubulin-folding cofactor B [Aethina tumida]|uniref:tubulin-folding cofactor B n=1 Tax=Aethina tumida TaxID=116153 RepID=UPI00214751C6|nr:tubulin-folding cofactor B [Aethina tumida]
MADFKVVTSDFVKVQISTSKNDLCDLERRFPKDLTINQLKGKLELMTGANCNTMQLQAYNKDNVLVCDLANDEALLGSYPIDDGMRIHVVDNFVIRNELDFGNVEKLELSDEIYGQKSNTVRAYLMRNKLGKYNEENQKKKEQQVQEDKEAAEKLTVGSRCKVTIQGASSRLGTVMYTGFIEELGGYFVGVKYDEPLGKNDGSIKGKRYFECIDKYGGFVKPQCVTCGDFPEEDYDLNEEI